MCARVILWSIFLLAVGCSKQDEKSISYGERSNFRGERVYLLLATEVFATYAPYLKAINQERTSLTFQSMEANLQLNLVRIKFVLKNEQLSDQTRAILEQTLRDYSIIMTRQPPVYRVWNVKGQIYDLGENEPILPRHYRVYDVLTE